MLSPTQEGIPSDSIMSTTEFPNVTSDSNSTVHEIPWTYREGVAILSIICTLSMIVNTRVLLSMRWIKRPLSATLLISLSLAAADLTTSLIVFMNFILNSYLPVVEGIVIPSCIALILEAFRLGGIINTVLHLLFLACNHYLGIVRPLHYQSIMTHRKITACLVVLWILPPVYMLVYFSTYSGEGFQNKDCISLFMHKFEFRIMFTLLLLIPFILMTCIYSHILLIVRRQQRSWFRAAERGASCRHRGGSLHNHNDTRRRPHNQHNVDHRRNQQMMRNIKALHTTLLILGSFVAGLLPPILVYIVVCENCAIRNWSGGYWYVLFWSVNVLLVTKPLANPIIYAARMHEIKEATRRMRTSLCYDEGSCRYCSLALPLLWLCCGWSAYDGASSSHLATQLDSHRGPWHRSAGADDATDSQHLCNTGSVRVTQLCRFTSNGQTKNEQINTEATRRMRTRLCYDEGSCRYCSLALPLLWLCCGWSAYDGASSSHLATQLDSHRGPWHRSAGADDATDSQHLCNTGSVRVTQLCRFTSNGQTKNEQINTVL